MNKITRERITAVLTNDLRQKYSAIPKHALPPVKVAENGSNEITQTVIKFLKAEGWQAERISTTGRYIQGNNYKDVMGINRQLPGKWIPGTSTRGSADISATIMGRSIKIEVKYGKDRQSDEQKKYQADIERAGGIYWIVKDLDGFLEMYDLLIKTTTQ